MAKAVAPGDPAPDFTAQTQGGEDQLRSRQHVDNALETLKSLQQG